MATQASTSLGTEDLTSTEALKAAVAELIATALFVLLGVGAITAVLASAGENAVTVIALAHGLAFALLTAGIAGISGGHVNPAVTFAMIITGQITLIRGFMYIVAQLLGACLAALLLRAFLVDELLEIIPGGGGQSVNTAVVGEAWHAMFLEALGTFVLVWTIFALALNPRSGAGNVAPLYAGLAVLAVYLFLTPLTGAGINPARTFGPALLLPAAADNVPGRWDDAWVYYVGPLLGAATASLSYYLLYLMPGRPVAGS